MEGRPRRNLFLALLGGGALLGVLIPLAGSTAACAWPGIGLPVGLIVGVILYVTD